MRHTLILGVLAAAILFSTSTHCSAFTPESPEVRTLIDRAVKYLTKDHIYDEPRRALAAMAIYKAGEPVTHPFIQASLKECKDMCRTPAMVDNTLRSVYAASVVGIFLCEVDPKQYEKEIRNVVESMEKRQKPFGGWGYPKPQTNWEFGDTSMTQYAVLFTWMAKAVGAADISEASIKKVADWLVRTQDVNGAWGYQGRDPGSSFTKRIPQTEVRHSLGVAGLGSLYICSGMMGITSESDFVSEGGLPPALKPVAPPKQPNASRANIDGKLIKKAMRDGDRWYEQNYRINPTEYTLYYLYTLERYQSFRETAQGRRPNEPRWYNDGVRFLRSKQSRSGKWDLEEGTDDLADTAFGILFLVRSAQKTIQKSQDEFNGLLVAGRGLPKSTEDVRMQRGKIVTTPFQGTAKALLDILGDENHPDFDSVVALDAVPISSNPKVAAGQLARMRRLVGAESFKTRLVAVKSLSRQRNLDNVPALIYALSDPDPRVMRAARDGLRFNSRKFNGFGLTDTSSDADREKAIAEWKKWYLEIRPDAAFLEN